VAAKRPSWAIAQRNRVLADDEQRHRIERRHSRAKLDDGGRVISVLE